MAAEVMAAAGTPWAVTQWVGMRWEATPAGVTAGVTLPVDAVTAEATLTAVIATATMETTDITMDAVTILGPRLLAV